MMNYEKWSFLVRRNIFEILDTENRIFLRCFDILFITAKNIYRRSAVLKKIPKESTTDAGLVSKLLYWKNKKWIFSYNVEIK